MHIAQLLVFKHILPAIAGSAFSFALVLIMLRMFSIKRPTVRRAFLFIPLIKPIFMLIGGISTPGIENINWDGLIVPVKPGMWMPDPLNLVPTAYDQVRDINGHALRPGGTKLFFSVLVVAGVLLLLLFIRRWLALHHYRTKLAKGEKVDRLEYATVFSVIEDLSRKLKIKTPGLVFADITSPATIGVRNPVIILPQGLVWELAYEELEAVLAHELAHIKRKDNIWLWLNIVARDLMFFNPFAWLTFKLLADERERAADYLAVSTTGKPMALATAFVTIAEKMVQPELSEPSWSVNNIMMISKSNLERRVNDLLDFKPYRRLILKMIPLGFLFLLLFYPRYTVDIQVYRGLIFSFFG